VFPDLYSERRHIVRGEPFVVVEGVLQQRNNTINLVAERIWPLSEARAEFPIPENLDTLAAPDATDVDVTAQQFQDPETELNRARQVAPASHNYR
jgi:hypothetical protein